MKLLHISDLHLGKHFYNYSLIEEQAYILDEIVRIAEEEAPDAVLIAGDVYDKSVPSEEAIRLMNGFINKLAGRGYKVFIDSGNHDSSTRLAFGNDLLALGGIYIAPPYEVGGELCRFALEDEYGKVYITMLPFVKQSQIKSALGCTDEAISYTEAVRQALANAPIDTAERNVLVTHLFVTGAQTCESDAIVGGLETVAADAFLGYDYVALGHLHNKQNIGSERVRYCGTPLKYSFSEANNEKSVTVVELGAKGEMSICERTLQPKTDVSELRGDFKRLTTPKFYEAYEHRNDYLHITLTDEFDVPDAKQQLDRIYERICLIDYDNTRTRTSQIIGSAENIRQRRPEEIFAEFYKAQNNADMDNEQMVIINELIEEIWKES